MCILAICIAAIEEAREGDFLLVNAAMSCIEAPQARSRFRNYRCSSDVQYLYLRLVHNQ